MGLINKTWCGMLFACEVWCKADAVCSDEELTLHTSAIYQTSLAKNTPHQPLLIKTIYKTKDDILLKYIHTASGEVIWMSVPEYVAYSGTRYDLHDTSTLPRPE